MSQAQKVPFVSSINNFTKKKIQNINELFGSVLPCSVESINGSMVTVNFEVDSEDLTLPKVTCPIAESQYVRLPVQVGDFGICIPASTRLGGISGLGLGLAPLGLPTNFGGMVFVPIGNTEWQAVDPNVLTIYGPNGVIIRDQENNSNITLTPTGIVVNGKTSLTLEVGGNSIVINSSGVSITGTLTINGTAFLAHHHGGVTAGGGTSGGVVP